LPGSAIGILAAVMSDQRVGWILYLQTHHKPAISFKPLSKIDWPIHGILPAVVLVCRGADDDLHERDRRDLEERSQKAERCEQGDEHRCHIITVEFDRQL
jgi:hypothetical protein